MRARSPRSLLGQAHERFCQGRQSVARERRHADHFSRGDELAARLRRSDPPVIARAAEGRLLLDPRTLDDEEAAEAASAVRAALAG